MDDRIDAFITRWAEVRYAFYKSACQLLTKKVSKKWIRLFEHDRIHSFIAVANFATKELGSIKAGDIFRSSSNKPAKYKRGNVFLPDFGNPFSITGSIKYLDY